MSQYQNQETIPGVLLPPTFGKPGSLLGPKGLALVSVNTKGTTTTGWGENLFMGTYNLKIFDATRHLRRLEADKIPAVALVMRSTRLVCIDIDGKSDSTFTGASRLGVLPPTLAETSKSGLGFHLFYRVDDDWDDHKGFARFSDVIGLEHAVDVRAVGCVYHYPQQRWNDRSIAKLPKHLEERLEERQSKRLISSGRISRIVAAEDPVELAILHDELLTELAKPIPPGRRNLSLFALGGKLRDANLPDWEKAIEGRGFDLGLEAAEVEKIIFNIDSYTN